MAILKVSLVTDGTVRHLYKYCHTAILYRYGAQPYRLHKEIKVGITDPPLGYSTTTVGATMKSVTVASDQTPHPCLLTLYCGHQEITTYLTMINTCILDNPEYRPLFEIFGLAIILKYHFAHHSWCVFHTNWYQRDLLATSTTPIIPRTSTSCFNT
jgi:hypothetical protein